MSSAFVEKSVSGVVESAGVTSAVVTAKVISLALLDEIVSGVVESAVVNQSVVKSMIAELVSTTI